MKIILFFLLIMALGLLGSIVYKSSNLKKECIQIHKESRYCDHIIAVGIFNQHNKNTRRK